MSDIKNSQFCFRCGKDIPILHSYREEINSRSKIHWSVEYCSRCGTVTNVEQIPFNYTNLLPRIGKIKSTLFVLLFGSPFLALAWTLGWSENIPIGGIIMTLCILGLAYFVNRQKIYEVENCKYKRWEQYSELVRK